MSSHVCPWWGGYFIDNPLRRLLHSPYQLLKPHVQLGATVLDFGCGMGFFAIPMAELVGPDGRVVAVDVQPKMLAVLVKRAERAGVRERILPHVSQPGSLGLPARLQAIRLDFVLAFYSLHEVADPGRICRELAERLSQGGRMLVVEPIGHVRRKQFARLLSHLTGFGLIVVDRPRIRLSHAAVLVRAEYA